jgi:Flp pilus assembly pilin Flp
MDKRIARRSRQRGQTSLEYFVVVAFGVLVLIEGGSSSAVSQVVTSMKDFYQGYAYAISFATNLNAF